MSDDGPACPYCLLNTSGDEPFGGWVYRDELWLVHHGPIATPDQGCPVVSAIPCQEQRSRNMNP
jgi:hypothetical protein